MSRIHFTEILPSEREKAHEILGLLFGLTIDSAETILLCAQNGIAEAKDKMVFTEEMIYGNKN